jgi:hypothetical protein
VAHFLTFGGGFTRLPMKNDFYFGKPMPKKKKKVHGGVDWVVN